jgi:simple sugar transport system ATP-binding protein
MTGKSSSSRESRDGIVLEMRGVTKRFGPLLANDAISLTLRKGDVVALLGENGAGKTTLMNILFGHYVADQGSIHIAGREGGLAPLPPGSPQAALEAGIGMVHQHFTLAENLTGFENILLGVEPILGLARGRGAAWAKVESLMADSGLEVELELRVSALTVGEKQRIEILKALFRDARVLVLDEPTAVLTPQESEGLFRTVARLAERGLAVVFISHKLPEVLAASHRIAVLRQGKMVGELATADADRGRLAELMVGREVPASRREAKVPGAAVLELERVHVEGLDARRTLHEIRLKVHQGEIVGIAGVAGNGQTALGSLLSGLVEPQSGSIAFKGQAVRRFSPQAFMAMGIGRIPEDRHHDGVVGDMSVAENLVIEQLDDRRFQKHGFLDFSGFRDYADQVIEAYDVRCPGPDAPARLLSGGNMQKLILARVLDREPALILANQPTRGLDVGAQTEVYKRLLAARERGAAVVLISEDLDELFTLADRIMVIHAGHLREAGPADRLDRREVGLMMAGHAEEPAP